MMLQDEPEITRLVNVIDEAGGAPFVVLSACLLITARICQASPKFDDMPGARRPPDVRDLIGAMTAIATDAVQMAAAFEEEGTPP